MHSRTGFTFHYLIKIEMCSAAAVVPKRLMQQDFRFVNDAGIQDTPTYLSVEQVCKRAAGVTIDRP